jgi:hypothetical protein
VKLGQVSDDRKTKPETIMAARRRAVLLTEPIENVRQEILGDSDTGVRNNDL